MPETTVNKDDLFSCRENQVGMTRKIFFMGLIPVSQAMKQLSDYKFWRGVFIFNAAHDGASVFRRDFIGHRWSFSSRRENKLGVRNFS